MVIRDLTLRSVQTFGSFHLIRMLLDELVSHLIEQKIQNAESEYTTRNIIIKTGSLLILTLFKFPSEALSQTHHQPTGYVPVSPAPPQHNSVSISVLLFAIIVNLDEYAESNPICRRFWLFNLI